MEVRKKIRCEEYKKELMTRLSRIEGQVRGIKNMVENDGYCNDILIQISAVRAALSSVSTKILEDHIKTCVSSDIRNGSVEKVDELMDTLYKLIK